MPDFEELASEKPNISALEYDGRWHDVVLAIEFALQEGPQVEERLELEVKAARVCADKLEDPARAKSWLERARARDPGRALSHNGYYELCKQLGAEQLLVQPQAGQPDADAPQDAAAAAAAPGPPAEGLLFQLPSWRPFRRMSLIAGGVWTVAYLPVALVIALAQGCEGLSAAVWPLLTVQLVLLLFIAGYFYQRYVWPTSRRELEVDETEVILRDGRGRELLRERRELFSPVVGSMSQAWSAFLLPTPALQLVGVGFRPVTLSCATSAVRAHHRCELIRGGVRYELDRDEWEQVIRALGLDTDPWGDPDARK